MTENSTLVEAATQLVLRERQSRDRGWWADWSQCFAEDSIVDMSWFTGSGAEFVHQTQLRFHRGRLGPAPAVPASRSGQR